MPNFEHPVDPARSFIIGKDGTPHIKAVTVGTTDNGLCFLGGVTAAHGVPVANGGFRLPSSDFESLCHEFLRQLDAER